MFDHRNRLKVDKRYAYPALYIVQVSGIRDSFLAKVIKYYQQFEKYSHNYSFITLNNYISLR